MWDTGDIVDSVRTLGTECEIQCGILGSVGWTIQAEKLRGRPQKSRLVVVGPVCGKRLGRGMSILWTKYTKYKLLTFLTFVGSSTSL